MRSLRTAALLALVAAVLSMGAAAPAVSARSKTETLCRGSDLRSSAGTIRDHLERGDRVIVVQRDRALHRTYVISVEGKGWIDSSALCGRRRR